MTAARPKFLLNDVSLLSEMQTQQQQHQQRQQHQQQPLNSCHSAPTSPYSPFPAALGAGHPLANSPLEAALGQHQQMDDLVSSQWSLR